MLENNNASRTAIKIPERIQTSKNARIDLHNHFFQRDTVCRPYIEKERSIYKFPKCCSLFMNQISMKY